MCGEQRQRVRHRVDKFAIVQCSGCALERLMPQPDASELERLYGEQYFESDDPASPGYAAYGAMEEALWAAAEVQLGTLPAVEHASEDRSLLDVGCGYGIFVAAARAAGWNARGMDCSASAAASANARYGVDVSVGDFASRPATSGPYDVITMWDAIEHFPDPVQALSSAYRSLKPGGRLIMSTPDTRSWDARLLGAKWYGYTKVPEHLWYFSPTTLRALGEQAGFEFVNVKPWGFVRSIGFCADKLGVYHPAAGRVSGWLANLFGLKDKRLFFAILDMLMVLERPLDHGPALARAA